MLFRVVLAVAVLAIFVYGLVDVIRTDGRLTRGISKPAWIVVMVVLPVLGAVLWLLIGRPRGNPPVRQAYSHPTAPDDDPDFLRNLEVRRRNQAEAARLKKLKDELEAKGKADGGSSGAGPDTGRRGPGTSGGDGGVDGGAAGDASSGDADTHDTDDRK
ncbi:PLD nuclease N-terminal domain-containing protein [Arthrobacter sp. B6]|uniref:PLD nuclease N-terminal domain-containing protein n=1 Tax=Arthrobacter sp. B6 TaxID=1570137 RepID=UPI000834E3E4|nr:PLD nuclease N-terminal domain-containing protein [Arthrobacter sp. B6]